MERSSSIFFKPDSEAFHPPYAVSADYATLKKTIFD